MKYSLTTTLLVLTCLSLLLAWYTERSRHHSAESLWQAERTNLLHAALVLSGRRTDDDVEVEDEDHVQIFPEDTELSFEQQQEIDKQAAAENLVVYVNLENEIKSIFQFYMEDKSHIQDAYESMIRQLWCESGRPGMKTMRKRVNKSKWKLSIERPEALTEWIQKFQY